MDYHTGNIYQGDWNLGHFNGKGCFYDKQQKTMYDGDYVIDVEHGKGIKQWNNGEEEYEGDWKQGEQTGKGRFTKANGNVYQGDFVKGQWTGKGKYYIAATETTYDGTFNNGVLSKGKIIYKDGSIFVGEIKNWQKNGQGHLKMTNGGTYVGTWEKDQKNGLLTLFKDTYKQREQYSNGVLKDTIKTPCAPGELEKQLENPGYGKKQTLKKK